ncbi:hypothetical protein JHK86_000115 [Glycine max]|nr:hypothetical protein JHK86_000115 [Glycine max]
MKRFMLPRNPLSDAAELPSSPSPTPTTSFAKLRPSSHKHKPSKENDLPSDPNLVTPSPAKLKSPLPPRPPSSNPLKRKLTIVDALTDNSLRFRHQGYCQDEAIVFGQGRRRSHSSEDCGKTYTMWGPANCLSHENDQQGLAPRVFQQLFARISEEQTKHSENQLSYQCHCSFLEIYNEPIMDLLDPNQKNLQEWSKELILLGHMVPVMWSQLISRGRYVAMGIWIAVMKKEGLEVCYENEIRVYLEGCKDGYVVSHYQGPREMLFLWQKLLVDKHAKCCGDSRK